MNCPLCNRSKKQADATLCRPCSTRCRLRLLELPALHKEAHYCLQPQRGGHGTNSGEPTLGINLSALDFVSGKAIIDCLHSWERVIRAERQLTPPALVPAQPTIEDEIRATVVFHDAHFDWIMSQDWADEYAREIASVNAQGASAAQRHVDPVKRIPCPTDMTEGLCGFPIPCKGDDLLEPVTCKRCNTDWTPARLIAVAMATPGQQIWLDVEAIATWIALSEKQVRRLLKQFDVPRRGQLFDFVTLNSHRLDSMSI